MSSQGSIEIEFLGGASGIGASCTLVRVAGTAFVVDCGVRYSGSSALPDLSPLADTTVDAILVTHAHMDHTGGLPVLAEACPGAPVFATPPTIDLVGILLRDSLRLMNGPDRESEVPLYTEHQVDQLLRCMAPVKYHQPIQVGESEIRWLPASHILGAAMIQIKTPAGTILFTGDYSISAQQTVPALGRPNFHADLVISESTYGERLHEDRNAAEERLLNQVRDVVDRGGRVLIPAFALGRAQEILLILKRALRNGNLAEVPVFVDGMVRAVCDVYRSHEPFVSRQLAHEIRRTPHAFYTDAIQRITRPEDRTRVLDTSPCIIVASSGMLSGGPSQGYSRELAKNANDAILLTGYQDEESPGRALLELARSEGPKELKLGQETVSVACQFGAYGLSAHADRMQMVSFIQAMDPRTVVLVHGDVRAKQTLARSLRCDDVILARDGLTLQRSYPTRRSSDRRSFVSVPTSADLDIERMRHLLGPAGEAPLRAAAVAEAWAGQAVDRATAEQLARVLESVGLVRRDDHRRDRLWVLAPHESGLFPDEVALEEQLKQENPKGRLLELCSRMRIDPPQTEVQPRGAFYEAVMSLCHENRTLASGPCRASSKRAAEQLAARALLDRMSTTADQQPVLQVTEDDAARLQAENPKGRLLEWCAKEKWASPQFEQEAVPGGFRIRGVLSLDTVEQTHKQFVVPPLGGLEATTTAKQPPEGGITNGLTTHLCGGCEETIATAWYGAAKLKAGEQAAAEAILRLLQRRQTTTRPQPPSKTAPPSLPVNRNAAMLLNELTQAGVLQATGYDVVDQSGPSHQPTFTVVAWATTAAGQTLRTEAVCASSKKSAQRTAADQLLDLLAQEGIMRIRETSS